MKRLTLAALGALALIGSAGAADLRGSSKDSMEVPVAGTAIDWHGAYIGAHGGYAWGTWEGTRNVGRTASQYVDSSCKAEDGTTYGGTEAACLEANGDFKPYSEELMGAESFSSNHTVDMNGWFGGVDISYKFRMSSFILEPFADVSFGGGKGGQSWSRDIATYIDANGDVQNLSDENIEGLSEAGGFSIKKQWGGTLGLKGGFLVSQRDYIYALGGLAYGNFKIKGGSDLSSASGHEVYAPSTAYNSDEGVWGWTLGAGYERAITNNLRLGFEGRYTRFEDIGASSSSSLSTPYDPSCPAGVKVDGHDGVNGDYDEWSVRARLSYKLN